MENPFRGRLFEEEEIEDKISCATESGVLISNEQNHPCAKTYPFLAI
jgi:hypothetical protein